LHITATDTWHHTNLFAIPQVYDQSQNRQIADNTDEADYAKTYGSQGDEYGWFVVQIANSC
jgi:hypothetical protein